MSTVRNHSFYGGRGIWRPAEEGYLLKMVSAAEFRSLVYAVTKTCILLHQDTTSFTVYVTMLSVNRKTITLVVIE